LGLYVVTRFFWRQNGAAEEVEDFVFVGGRRSLAFGEVGLVDAFTLSACDFYVAFELADLGEERIETLLFLGVWIRGLETAQLGSGWCWSSRCLILSDRKMEFWWRSFSRQPRGARGGRFQGRGALDVLGQAFVPPRSPRGRVVYARWRRADNGIRVLRRWG
jgi:hypothetical protein